MYFVYIFLSSLEKSETPLLTMTIEDKGKKHFSFSTDRNSLEESTNTKPKVQDENLQIDACAMKKSRKEDSNGQCRDENDHISSTDTKITEDQSIGKMLDQSFENVNETDHISLSDTSVEGLSTNKTLDELIKNINKNHHTSKLPATWVNWLLCLTFGIQALTIGFAYGIGPIYLKTEFGTETGEIGLLFSLGTMFGSISAIFFTCTKSGNKLLRSVIQSPFDLCFAMVGTAIGAVVVCVPSFAVSSLGFVILFALNDLGSTLITELQTSITTVSSYSVIGPTGQIVRRILNSVTALTRPLLFGILPSLPFYVTGGVTIVWTIVLFIALKFRMKHTRKEISLFTDRRRSSIKKLLSFVKNESVLSIVKEERACVTA